MKKFNGDNRDKSIVGGWISHEDTSCYIFCECGEDIKNIVSSHQITRCPKCKRGYRVEFVVWQYDPGERINE